MRLLHIWLASFDSYLSAYTHTHTHFCYDAHTNQEQQPFGNFIHTT